MSFGKAFGRLALSVRTRSFQLFRKVHDRIDANGFTFDVNLLISNPEIFYSHFKSRNVSNSLLNDIDIIKDLQLKRNECILKNINAKTVRKRLSKKIGDLIKVNNLDDLDHFKAQVNETNNASAEAMKKQSEIENKINSMFSFFPNLLDDSVPSGTDSSDNVVLKTWGQISENSGDDDQIYWHDNILNGLDGIKSEAAAKMSGSRFNILTGQIAKLERAVINYCLDRAAAKGYMEVSVPHIVAQSALHNTGQLPKFEMDLFHISHTVAGEKAYLIPTAEVPLTNIHQDSILSLDQLPIKYASHSLCFRAEAGANGRDSRGLLRQHQFSKIELVKIVRPDASAEEHRSMLRDVEELLKALEIPHRTVLLCSGDTGFSARLCCDVEVWLPGQRAYREVSSVSNCYDFQAKRMKMRYRDGQRLVHPHTLNGSGLAVGRTLVALLENGFDPRRGSVRIPAPLRPYLGTDELLPPSKT